MKIFRHLLKEVFDSSFGKELIDYCAVLDGNTSVEESPTEKRKPIDNFVWTGRIQ
jgi:hypothetical protein